MHVHLQEARRLLETHKQPGQAQNIGLQFNHTNETDLWAGIGTAK